MRQHAKCHSQTYTYIFQMLYLQYTSYQIMWTLISLPLQMAECLHRVQPVAVANHVKAHQSPIEHAVTWLATETGWAHSKRSAICSGKLCGSFIIVVQCCLCGHYWITPVRGFHITCLWMWTAADHEPLVHVNKIGRQIAVTPWLGLSLSSSARVWRVKYAKKLTYH